MISPKLAGKGYFNIACGKDMSRENNNISFFPPLKLPDTISYHQVKHTQLNTSDIRDNTTPFIYQNRLQIFTFDIQDLLTKAKEIPRILLAHYS